MVKSPVCMHERKFMYARARSLVALLVPRKLPELHAAQRGADRGPAASPGPLGRLAGETRNERLKWCAGRASLRRCPAGTECAGRDSLRRCPAGDACGATGRRGSAGRETQAAERKSMSVWRAIQQLAMQLCTVDWRRWTQSQLCHGHRSARRSYFTAAATAAASKERDAGPFLI